MYRQGDLLIQKIEAIPEGTTQVITGIVLEGEATGHHHRLQGGSVLAKDGLMFLDVSDKALLVHEEHKPIALTKGKYAVIRQREYMSKDMVRVVVD